MRRFAAVALAVAVAMVLASPIASSSPDGLERVAVDKGFAQRQAPRNAPSGVAAGVAGTLLVFALGYGLATVRRRSAPA